MTSAASGSTTPIPAQPATCPPTSTRSRTTSAATGRSRAPRRGRSSTTSTTPQRKHGVIDRVRTGTEVVSADFDAPQRPLDACHPDGRALRGGRAGARLRAAEPPAVAVDSRDGRVRGPGLPLGRVGPRLRPRRQAGGRDRNRRERHPVRAPGGRARRPLGRLPAQRAVPVCRARTPSTGPSSG